MVVRLLNIGLAALEPGNRRRVWLQPGVPVVIGPRLVMSLHFVRDLEDDEHTEVVMRVQGPEVQFEAPVPAACWVDLSAWAGLQAIPRALEMGGRAPGRPARVLVEFVRVREGIQWAV